MVGWVYESVSSSGVSNKLHPSLCLSLCLSLSFSLSLFLALIFSSPQWSFFSFYVMGNHSSRCPKVFTCSNRRLHQTNQTLQVDVSPSLSPCIISKTFIRFPLKNILSSSSPLGRSQPSLLSARCTVGISGSLTPAAGVSYQRD